jgi:phosphoribosyl 1,2-cyclic phosphodiesterase
LEKLEKSIEDLSGILISHEHSDHWKGVEAISEKYGIPIFLSAGCMKAKNIDKSLHGFNIIDSHNGFDLGDIRILPVPMPHDAREPIQFIFESAGYRLGILTDLGHYTSHIVDLYSNCHGLLLEANYDESLLCHGPYPKFLKERISGVMGHLSNSQAAELLDRLDLKRLSCLLIGHVSAENNSIELIKSSILRSQAGHIPFAIADQADGSDWLTLS